MKRIVFLFVSLFIFITLSACSKDISPDSQSSDRIGVSYPQFAHPASEEPFLRNDISFNITKAQGGGLKKSIKIYQARPLTINEDYKERILEAFEFQNYSSNVDELNITNYSFGNKQISIYPNGIFNFETTYDTDRKEFPFSMTNEDVGQTAKNFLTSHGLLPNGFVLTDRVGEQGVTFEENGIEQTVVTAKGAWFQRMIDGIEVIGTSKILVMLNTDGIFSVSSVYSQIGEATEVNLIDMNEALKRAKTNDSLLKWELNKLKGNETKAVVDKVKIVYYDDPLDQNATHIQPCYYFEGKATDELNNVSNFSIVVPALAKELYLSSQIA